MGRQLQLLLKKKDKTVMIKRTICIKRGNNMNFHNKKTRRIMAIVIIVIVAAMIVTAVLPAMMG